MASRDEAVKNLTLAEEREQKRLIAEAGKSKAEQTTKIVEKEKEKVDTALGQSREDLAKANEQLKEALKESLENEKEAKKAKELAERNAKEAEKQKTEAEKAKGVAEKAKSEAVTAKEDAVKAWQFEKDRAERLAKERGTTAITKLKGFDTGSGSAKKE
jgi:hypothetical protein